MKAVQQEPDPHDVEAGYDFLNGIGVLFIAGMAVGVLMVVGTITFVLVRHWEERRGRDQR